MKKFVILMAVFIFLTGCSSPRANIDEQNEAEKLKIEQTTELINYALSNDITDAIPMFFDDFNNTFTIELQSKYKGKNVVFYSSVSDIYQENGKNYLLLTGFLENYIIVFECDVSIIENLLNSGLKYDQYSWVLEEIIIVANIESISRLHYEVRVDGDYEEGYDLYLDNNNVTEVKGKCIAVDLINYE